MIIKIMQKCIKMIKQPFRFISQFYKPAVGNSFVFPQQLSCSGYESGSNNSCSALLFLWSSFKWLQLIFRPIHLLHTNIPIFTRFQEMSKNLLLCHYVSINIDWWCSLVLIWWNTVASSTLLLGCCDICSPEFVLDCL